jgi:AcrR family transcriptional regulator
VPNIDRQLVEAAMRMFARYGSGVTMNAIVEESGLSRKTVYARYPNKSALLLAVLKHLLDAGGQQALVIPERDSVEESLYAFILASLQEVCTPEATALRRMIMIDPRFLDQVRQDIELVVVRRYMDPLLGYLRGLGAGHALNELDLQLASDCLINLILSESHRRFFQETESPPPGELERHARHLARLFCFGIMGNPPADRPLCGRC